MGCGCNKKTKSGVPQATKVDPKLGFVAASSSVKSVVNEPKKKEPSLLKKALSLGEAVANHVVDGMSKCTKEENTVRLNICMKCPELSESTCTKCGCMISIKAGWKTATCPLDKWPQLD